MQTKTLIGTSVDHTKVRRGGSWQLRALLVFLASLVVGCQQHVLVDLLNGSGAPIQVLARSHGRDEAKIISSGERLLYFGTGPVEIACGAEKYEYPLVRIPADAFRSRIKGRVVSFEFASDGKLYLLKADKKNAVTRIEPQPEPFPLSPVKRASEGAP